MKKYFLFSIDILLLNIIKRRYPQLVLDYFVLNIGLSNNTVVKTTHLLKQTVFVGVL